MKLLKAHYIKYGYLATKFPHMKTFTFYKLFEQETGVPMTGRLFLDIENKFMHNDRVNTWIREGENQARKEAQ